MQTQLLVPRHTSRLAAAGLILMSGLFALLPSPVLAQNAGAGDWIEYLVSPTTIVLVELEPEQIELPTQALPADADPSARGMLSAIQNFILELRQISGGGKVYVTLDVPYSAVQPVLRVQMLAPGPGELEKLSSHLEEMGWSPPIANGPLVAFAPTREFTLGDAASMQKDVFPGGRPEVTAALNSVAAAPIRIVVVPPAYLWRTFRELMPQLPPELGGGKSSLLTDGVQWAGIAIDPAKLSVEAKIQSATPEAAVAFAEYLPDFLVALTGQLPDAQFASVKALAKPVAGLLQPQVAGSQVSLSLGGPLQVGSSSKLVAALLDSVVDNVMRPLNARQKMDRFKQLALAMHNYAAVYNCFPVAEQHRNEDGSARLSWRVHLLPYLGEMELFNQFHLDEAWDSPHNIQLLEKMPDIYQASALDFSSADKIKAGHTVYSVPVSERTISGGKEPTRFGMITDGTSNTVLLIELKPESAVPWTAPQDYEFDPAQPTAGLAVTQDGTFFVAMADGSASALPSDMPAEDIVHLFEMNDGQVVRW